VYRAIRQIHLYSGLVLALLLLVFAVTGAGLVYKEAYWRAAYPELRGGPSELSAQDHAEAVAAAEARFGPDLRSVKLPERGVPAYHLYLENGEALLTPGDHRLIDRWGKTDRVMAFLFDLHAHLLSGRTGEWIGGMVGLAGTGMAVTGVVLWWPARRRFRLANLWPQGLSRRALIRWHRDLGLVFTPLLVLLLLTGSGLVFYATAGAILNGLFGDPVPQRGPVEVADRGRQTGLAGLPDAAAIERARRVFPDGRLVFVIPANGPDEPITLRLKQDCELHPNGRSFLYLHPVTGEVLSRRDACAGPPGQKALHALYPLHAAKIGSPIYKAATVLASLALAVLCVTGVLAYIRSLRRRSNSGRRGRRLRG